MSDTNFLLDKFKAQGYVVLHDYLPKEITEGLVSEFHSIVQKLYCPLYAGDGQSQETPLNQKIMLLYKHSPQKVINCGKVANHGWLLWKLATSVMMRKICTELGLRQPSIAIRPVLLFNNKNIATAEHVWKTPPHQDFNSFRGSLNSIVIWIPLTDITPELGPLEVIPGSHLKGSQAKEIKNGFGIVETDESFVSLPVEKGDVVVFSSLLVHRSGENTTEDKLRLSASFRYSDVMSEDWQRRGYKTTNQYGHSIGTEDLAYPTAEDMQEVL